MYQSVSTELALAEVDQATQLTSSGSVTFYFSSALSSHLNPVLVTLLILTL
jgi:hypothetical protein